MNIITFTMTLFRNPIHKDILGLITITELDIIKAPNYINNINKMIKNLTRDLN